jgi:hypothetical protein
LTEFLQHFISLRQDYYKDFTGHENFEP